MINWPPLCAISRKSSSCGIFTHYNNRSARARVAILPPTLADLSQPVVGAGAKGAPALRSVRLVSSSTSPSTNIESKEASCDLADCSWLVPMLPVIRCVNAAQRRLCPTHPNGVREYRPPSLTVAWVVRPRCEPLPACASSCDNHCDLSSSQVQSDPKNPGGEPEAFPLRTALVLPSTLQANGDLFPQRDGK